MADDLKLMVKEIKKKVKGRSSPIMEVVIEKIDTKKQKEELFNFLSNYNTEMKKSGQDNKYIGQLIKDFEDMKLSDIRFIVEKMYDKNFKVLSLMKKYDMNFSEEEIKKYEEKNKFLTDTLSFMVESHIGEYINVEERD